MPALSPDSLPEGVATPCFVVLEDAILANLAATARACGGVQRLMPHVKTHRAEWVVRMLLELGVRAYKTATVTEAAMVLAAGAPRLVWAYPTLNRAHIVAFIALARRYPGAALGALVDSPEGVALWHAALGAERPANLRLIVDLDPGMGRTGAPIGPAALDLASDLQALGYFGGWHVYDGHIQDKDIAQRRARVDEVAQRVRALLQVGAAEGLPTELIAGASYSFDLWPADLANHVAPGSWVYSSSQHDAELAHLGWTPGAFVLATVMSRRGATATLDAGSKAIAPDKPVPERFRWDGKILMMSEEHAVVADNALAPGERVLLMPKHACTTAYLYPQALVRTLDGRWEYRPQLGSTR